MDYQKEISETRNSCIDCYWESHEMNGEQSYVYPSVPEPYINIYFPVDSSEKAQIKGISSRSDFFEMKSKLFGVRFFLKGYYQLKLKPAHQVSDTIQDLDLISGAVETELSTSIAQADSFSNRVQIFQNYFERKLQSKISSREQNISEAFQYLVNNYRSPNVIQDYSSSSGYSTRTIHRWFSKDIGISPKKLGRIARFHQALSGLHGSKESGFYFDCGYFDQAHFIREFREFTGITPEEYFRIVSDLYNS